MNSLSLLFMASDFIYKKNRITRVDRKYVARVTVTQRKPSHRLGQRWECDQRRSQNCRAIGTTDLAGCFYHLTQSTWRRIQSEGLQRLYREDSTVRHFCGMLDGLAFLSVADVKEGMRVLQGSTSDGLECLVEYFDSTYVNGTYRMVICDNRMRFRRTAPRFQLATWNVDESTMAGRETTNNVCEGWNNGFSKLFGHSNPSLDSNQVYRGGCGYHRNRRHARANKGSPT